MNEKIGGAEGTKLDDDFVEMEKVNLANFKIKKEYSGNK